MGKGQNELILHDVEIHQISEFKPKSMVGIDSRVKHSHDYFQRLRVLFDEVRLQFYNKFLENKKGQNFVPALGDGQPLDLFKIFWAVWNRGGCDFVSENKLWGSVAEECKINSNIADESLKVMYMKYISELDRSLQMAINRKSLENGNGENEKIGLLMAELQEEFSKFVANKKNSEDVVFMQNNDKKYHNVHSIDLNEVSDIVENSERAIADEKFVAVEEKNDFKKRKREAIGLSAILNWVVEVAKHPDDLSGILWRENLRDQALLAREALLRRKCYNSSMEYSQKKLKIDPSIYEDGNIFTPQFAENIRISERVKSVTKPRICPCCDPSSKVHENLVSPLEENIENNPKNQADTDVEIFEINEIGCSSEEEKFQKCISVGPFFQAQIPQWTGKISESDSKWLGTRMWPPENKIHFSNFENNFIFRKKQCGCRSPGSVACVRFHIAESRMKLRREIGLLFYKWRFHVMGEEVSLSWTFEEEKRFKLLVKSKLGSPSSCFWNNIAKFFPDKNKEKLISYYLNVFLIGRRAYQNRVASKDVDSDDNDLSEFERFGGRFGNEALNSAENKMAKF